MSQSKEIHHPVSRSTPLHRTGPHLGLDHAPVSVSGHVGVSAYRRAGVVAVLLITMP
jgi:hypothetical protein